MTTVDASIPLQVQQFQAPDQLAMYGKMMGIKELMQQGQLNEMKLQEGQQNLKNQQLLAQIAAVPGNYDPKIGFTDQAIAQIAQQSPQLAQQINATRVEAMGKQAALDQHQATTHKELTERAIKQNDYIDEVVRMPALLAYHQAIKDGKPSDAAMAIGQKVFSDGIEEAKRSGDFSEKDKGSFIATFDPARVAERSEMWQKKIEKDMADKLAQDKETRAEEERKKTPFIKETEQLQSLRNTLSTLPKGSKEYRSVAEQMKELSAHITRMDRQPGTENKPPSGYRWTKEGDQEMIPGGPAARERRSAELADLNLLWRANNPGMAAGIPGQGEMPFNQWVSINYPNFIKKVEAKSGSSGKEKTIVENFKTDPAMKGKKLGKKTPKGYEVYDAAGKRIGHYH